MILLSQSNNRILQNIQKDLPDSEFFEYGKDYKDINLFIFYSDPYLDKHHDFLDKLSDTLDFCKKHNASLLYLDTLHLYGLTEFTGVDENHLHRPYSHIGKIRDKAYQMLKDVKDLKDLKVLILRFPSFLGRGTNLFLNNFFDGQSNFIKWPGSTAINHEFIFEKDAIKIILAQTARKDLGNFEEYNISGSKYTIEQIAAQLNELYGIAVKIHEVSPLTLWVRSLVDHLYQDIFESAYLYKKPVFLNSSKYEEIFGTIQKTKLTEGLREIME